jgi:predicted flap endonuclease-1-like 5' DNA nuclease
MSYLLTQIWLYLLVAVFIGILFGSLIWGTQVRKLKAENVELNEKREELETCQNHCRDLTGRLSSLERQLWELKISDAAAIAVKENTEIVQEKDNLRRLLGIGPENERLLHSIGVTTYAQIAAWTPEDIKLVEDHLQFGGRIERERWIEQATLLAEGNEEEYLRRFPASTSERNT